ncbi:MAG TPA: hypothetical protein VGQ83_42720 [Polyangia bacterium]|jgi:hypothetical protein
MPTPIIRWEHAATILAVILSACGPATRGPATARPAGGTAPDPPFEVLGFDPRALPAGVTFPGQLVAGARWRDARGDNVLVLSRKSVDDTPGHPTSVWLWARHFTGARLVREVADRSEGCPEDNITRFREGALAITDLDHDGLGEATFAYTVGCVSDVSPVPLKLVLLEDGAKWILRGRTRVLGSGGEHTAEPPRAQWPPVLYHHAASRWRALLAPE